MCVVCVVLVLLVVNGVQHVDCVTFSTSFFELKGNKREKRGEKEIETEKENEKERDSEREREIGRRRGRGLNNLTFGKGLDFELGNCFWKRPGLPFFSWLQDQLWKSLLQL
jgi:hypothetical protein